MAVPKPTSPPAIVLASAKVMAVPAWTANRPHTVSRDSVSAAELAGGSVALGYGPSR